METNNENPNPIALIQIAVAILGICYGAYVLLTL